jgi:FKBP-type peptidyl-prolyl cis-trans isomerase
MPKITVLPVLILALLLFACSPAEEETPANNAEQVPVVPDNVAGPPDDADSSGSGLAWVVLREGDGARNPRPEDRVRVHYSGWQTDGEMFDSSVVRGEPAEFPLGRLIEGWVEGLQLMTEGEKRRFWIPGELAYDERPDRPGAPKGMLVFDVELIEILSEQDDR